MIAANDFEFIDRIWGDWSPGYDASEDLPLVKECIRAPEHLQAALGYYWGQFDPTRFGSPDWAAEQAAAWGYSLRQPTLYLHGTTDGCHGMTQAQVERVPDYCGPGHAVRARKPVIRSLISAGRSTSMKWPTPSISSASEPGPQ